VRIPDAVVKKGPKVLLAERGDGGKMQVSSAGQKRNSGIVVDVGPGRVSEAGTVVPVNTAIKAGATVVFPGKVACRPDDYKDEMEAEGLYLVPASMILFVVRAESARGAITA
jgi:co-chaperonin GroES (HSP10)